MRVAILAALLLLSGCFQPQPSILVILLDDARPDEIPTLAEDGIHFPNAYVTSPSCGPSRASFLTGRFKASRYNGYPADFDHSDTLGTRMQAAGYATAFLGKWVNSASRHMPMPAPGWDRWAVYRELWGAYNWTVSDEADTISRPGGHADEWMLDQVVDWLDHVEGPSFTIWATHGPHVNWPSNRVAPPPGYAGILGGSPADNRLRSMEFGMYFADALAELRERYPDLVIVFTSDNGYSRGENGWTGKACPFWECVNVPLRVYGPNLRRVTIPQEVTLEDLAATILVLGGADSSGIDGCNLFVRRGQQCRKAIPFSHGGSAFPSARWEATLSRRGMAIEWDPRDTDWGSEFIPRGQWRQH